jgi:hypothetical protein
MLNLPPAIMTVLLPFAPLFQARTWRKAQILLIGTILTPGKRTVTAALRVMSLKDGVDFAGWLDAALYEPAPPYRGLGRPRKKGKRLPTPQQFLESPETRWTTVEVHWYDGQTRVMQIASGTAVWFHTGKPAVPIRWVLIRDPQDEHESVSLLCTDPTVVPQQIVEWFVMRWQLEVTFEEARRHLGVETQRQWSDKAIARTTPLLLGLFSWVTLAAHALHSSHCPVETRQDAWYAKPLPTFSDALALVRRHLWTALPTFQTSGEHPDMVKIPRSFFVSLVDTLCYAA